MTYFFRPGENENVGRFDLPDRRGHCHRIGRLRVFRQPRPGRQNVRRLHPLRDCHYGNHRRHQRCARHAERHGRSLLHDVLGQLRLPGFCANLRRVLHRRTPLRLHHPQTPPGTACTDDHPSPPPPPPPSAPPFFPWSCRPPQL